MFLDAHKTPPARITLDLDAADDPIHGQQGEQERGASGAAQARAARFGALVTRSVRRVRVAMASA